MPKLNKIQLMTHVKTVKYLVNLRSSPFLGMKVHEIGKFLSKGTAKECLAKLIVTHAAKKSNFSLINEESSECEAASSSFINGNKFEYADPNISM